MSRKIPRGGCWACPSQPPPPTLPPLTIKCPVSRIVCLSCVSGNMGLESLRPPQSLALGSLNSPPFCLQRVESAVSYAGNPVPLLVFLSLLGHVRKSF